MIDARPCLFVIVGGWSECFQTSWREEDEDAGWGRGGRDQRCRAPGGRRRTLRCPLTNTSIISCDSPALCQMISAVCLCLRGGQRGRGEAAGVQHISRRDDRTRPRPRGRARRWDQLPRHQHLSVTPAAQQVTLRSSCFTAVWRDDWVSVCFSAGLFRATRSNRTTPGRWVTHLRSGVQLRVNTGLTGASVLQVNTETQAKKHLTAKQHRWGVYD